MIFYDGHKTLQFSIWAKRDGRKGMWRTEECEFWIFVTILETWNPLKCWKTLENHKIYISSCKKHSILICVDHLSPEQTCVKNRCRKSWFCWILAHFQPFSPKNGKKLKFWKNILRKIGRHHGTLSCQFLAPMEDF